MYLVCFVLKCESKNLFYLKFDTKKNLFYFVSPYKLTVVFGHIFVLLLQWGMQETETLENAQIANLNACRHAVLRNS